MDDFMRFEGWTREQVVAKVAEIGNGYSADPYADNQNESPTLGELLALADDYKVTFIGYVISQPRGDYRVTVDGVLFENLSPDEAARLMQEYENADKKDYQNGSLYLWWD